MQNLKSPPSTFSSSSQPPLNGANGHDRAANGNGVYADAIASARAADVAATPPKTILVAEAPRPANRIPTVREILANPPRSAAMQVRFMRDFVFFAWLFIRLIFWHLLVAKYAPEWVERGNIARWKKYARDFRDFAVQMGGVMIKAGQFVSTRSDVLPQEVIDELADLRDTVPNVSTAKIRAILKQELGDLNARYAMFEDRPVAAASLGQVHRARLLNGDRVVVKVQRPGIADICYTDLRAMVVVARIAMRFRFVNKRMNAVALVEEFGRVLLEELSYRQEMDNAARFAEIFRNDLGVYIPQIYAEHSTDCVLTIEDVTTIKLDDYDGMARAGIDRKAVAKRLMDSYLRMIFDERFFHADPHAGNLFVYPLNEGEGGDQDAGDGRPFYLIFIDFGMTGALTKQILDGLIDTMSALVTRDARKLVMSYQDLGLLLPSADIERLTDATRLVFDQVWGMSMAQMTSASFDSMAEISEQFGDLLFDMPFQMPQDFIYLGRTVGILSGMYTTLDPSLNPWNAIQPYAQKMMLARGAGGDSSGSLLTTTIQNVLGGAGKSIGSLLFPGVQTRDLTTKLERGEIKVRVAPSSDFDKLFNMLATQEKKTQRTVATVGSLVIAAIFYTNGDGVLTVIALGAAGAVWLGGVFGGE